MAQLGPAEGPPPKPWEQVCSTSGPPPFKPPSAGSTSEVVEASGTANPGEIIASSNMNATANGNTVGRPVPPRPWIQGGGVYGNNVYRGGYGGGIYGNMYRGGYGGPYGGLPGMYGGGVHNGGFRTGMGVPNGVQDPNITDGASPPGFWISFLQTVQDVVNWFSRIALLVDQNTQAIHLFFTALLQIFDRSGLLYGELARFVLRLLGIKPRKPEQVQQQAAGAVSAPKGPKAARK